MLVTLLFPIMTMRARIKPSASARQLDVAAWKEPPFALFAAGTFLAFVGLYIPYFYIQLYSLKKTAVEHDVALYLLSMLNAGSLIGRIVSPASALLYMQVFIQDLWLFRPVIPSICRRLRLLTWHFKIPNYIADRIGALNSMILCSLSATVLGFCWIPTSSLAGLIVFSILYGFFSGGFISLGPTVVVSLSPSLDVVGNRMGLLFGPCSIGLLIGSPIAGEILGEGWLNLQTFCGAMIAVATASLLGARITKGCMNLKAIV